MDTRSETIYGTYYDGQVADPRDVIFTVVEVEPAGIDPRDELRFYSQMVIFLEIKDRKLDHEIAHWDIASIYAKPSRKGELRLAANGQLPGARLVVSDARMAKTVRDHLPHLARHKSKRRARQSGLIIMATLAMASVVGAYLYGIPLLAGRIVGLIPAQTEIDFGETIVGQLADAFSEEGGLALCDADPESMANVAIRRFTTEALAGVDTPFSVDIQVVNNEIPNAFALPGGHAYYFAGLLGQTDNPDQFAGVMAHEIGHVVHRHGMQQLISTAGTGLLVGFVLGDITGLSVAGGVGASLINTSFSREAEREADTFSYQVAQRLNFDASGLADLLDKIGEDDADSLAMALLSTHPLNQERRAALAAFEQNSQAQVPAFSDEEWEAIRSMCGASETSAPSTTPSGKVKTKG